MKVAAGILLILLTFGYSVYKNNNHTHEQAVVKEALSFEEEQTENADVVVDVGGEVASPAVIKLPADSRVYEAINKAEGITEYGDMTLINPAEGLIDGKQIFIPKSKNKTKQSGMITVIDKSTSGKSIYISISGQVKNSGIIILPDNSRVNDAVLAAGGLLPGADTQTTNLAEKLTDGMKINIAKIGERPADSSLININTADAESLDKLKGIGPSLAEAIIEYRENNGRFKKIEDIKNVSGIGDKTFEKFKDKICVY